MLWNGLRRAGSGSGSELGLGSGSELGLGSGRVVVEFGNHLCRMLVDCFLCLVCLGTCLSFPSLPTFFLLLFVLLCYIVRCRLVYIFSPFLP